MAGTVFFDIETADAGELFRRPDFTRLYGAARESGPVGTTTDVRKLLGLLDRADEVVAHNGMNFDLLALAFHHGADWEKLAAKARDTLIMARLDDPPLSQHGTPKGYYGLDELAKRRGEGGKITGEGGLGALKTEFKGYDRIPLDDPRYLAYLRQDVEALRDTAAHYPWTDYARREHALYSLTGRMTLNGFRVDLPLLEERIEQGQRRKQAALTELGACGLPLSRTVLKGPQKAKYEVEEFFSAPFTTTEGKRWVERLWRRFGVHRPPRTEKGALSTKADALSVIAEHEQCPPELRKIIGLMAVVTTTRTVYQTAKDNLVGDRVHPVTSWSQASGRGSTSGGMTVYGKRDGRHHERDIFVPEVEHVLLTCDISQGDMRVLAGLSQDRAYMDLFGFEADGTPKDAHTMIASLLGISRHDAKARGHGWNYGLGEQAMIEDGADPAVVRAFFDGMHARFPGLIQWQEKVRAIGRSGQLLDNGFGRKMRCHPNAAYTEAPALMGQGGTRDLLVTALLRLPDWFRPYLRLTIHDELACSVPADHAEDARRVLERAFTFEWEGVPIICDVSKPSASWGAASEK